MFVMIIHSVDQRREAKRRDREENKHGSRGYSGTIISIHANYVKVGKHVVDIGANLCTPVESRAVFRV